MADYSEQLKKILSCIKSRHTANGVLKQAGLPRVRSMKPRELILRCYAEEVGDQWQAFCLDLSLAAQGETFDEVKRKLDDMIAEYVYDALAGEDREHGPQLLTRRAPLRDWLKYYWYCLLIRTGALHVKARRLFTSLVPLEPSSRYHHA